MHSNKQQIQTVEQWIERGFSVTTEPQWESTKHLITEIRKG